MKTRVIVTLKPSVLDPQGKAIEGALNRSGSTASPACARARCSTSSSTASTARRPTRCCARPARSCSPTPSSRTTRSSMTKPMKAAVILFPGSNREGDVARALQRATGDEPAIVWHDETDLPAGTDLVVLPGGFSYGDYLRCGAIAARARVMAAVSAHAARGGLVLGICNGFQILCEAGPAAGRADAQRRAPLRLQDADICGSRRTPPRSPAATRPGEVVKFAHRARRGQLYRRRRRTIAALEGSGRVAFRYCDARGPRRRGGQSRTARLNDIAGVYNDRLQRARADAASREPDRSAGRRRRWTGAFRLPRGLRAPAGARLERPSRLLTTN